MKLMPLSDYISRDTYEPPKGSYSEENDYVPVDKVLSMDPVTFFNKANELMVKNSPAAADKEMLEKIAAANVGPGMEFDTSVLTGDVTENWKTMLTEIRIKIIKEGQKFSKKLGQWDYFGEPIGDFNTAYAYRALVALAGLGANTVEVALYPKIEQDAGWKSSHRRKIISAPFRKLSAGSRRGILVCDCIWRR